MVVVMMMELGHFRLLLLFLIPFAYLCLHKLILRKKSQRLPPGRTGLPLLGETLDFWSKAKQGVLHKFVTDRRNKYSSNIFRTSLMGHPMAIVCDAEGNKFLFSNENKFFKQWFPSSVDKVFPKSDNKPTSEHMKSTRKLLGFILRTDVLREYVGEMDKVMKQVLQTDWTSEQVNVDDAAKRYISKLACNIFFGIEDQGKIEEVQEAMDKITAGLHSIHLDVPGSALHRAIKASKLMRKEFEEMVRQRKIDFLQCSLSPRKDFISHMLLATDENGQFFNEVDIASDLLGMLFAAYGTMHRTITNIMMLITEHPDVYNLVFGEQREIQDLNKAEEITLRWEDIRKMEYSWSVAREVLRLKPPSLGGFKEAITDVSYGGYTIPKGWKIHWNTFATHMNPEYFPEPEKFDPSRFQGEGPSSYTFIPFGGGAHMCPGNEYARVAILVFLHNVVTKFRWEKIIASPAKSLSVILYPHKQ